jgi:hypothetical protein
LPGGPVTPTRVTSTFRFVELAPALTEEPLADAAEAEASREASATGATPR